METSTLLPQTGLPLRGMSPTQSADPGRDAMRRLEAATTGDDGGRDMERVRKAAEDFEAVFITQMLNSMWEGVEPDPMFGGGQGETVFRGLLMDEYGKAISRSGGIGLAEHVHEILLQAQER